MRRNERQKTFGPLTKHTPVIQAEKKRNTWISANPYTGGIPSLEMLC